MRILEFQPLTDLGVAERAPLATDFRHEHPNRAVHATAICGTCKIWINAVQETTIAFVRSESRRGSPNCITAETLGEFRYDSNCSTEAKAFSKQIRSPLSLFGPMK